MREESAAVYVVPAPLGNLADLTRRAEEILQNWDEEKANFIQVCPKEMLPHLKHPIAEVENLTAVPAE